MINSAQNRLKEISSILLKEAPKLKNTGLLNGKMGISLFFFHLARETGKPEHQEFAEQLIDDVYEEVSNNRLPLDFENGIAGIAWGIEYLVQQGFVDAETDLILRDVDDRIYRFVTTNRELFVGVKQGIMGYMLYIFYRLQGKDLKSKDTQIMIFKRLLTDLVNRLGTAIEKNKLIVREPRLFDITWELPISLILLGWCYSMNVHTAKIERILENLTPVALSLYPYLTCNRMFLLYGIESVTQQIPLPKWEQRANLLRQNIRLTDILNEELTNKNIFFHNGIAGIAFISRLCFQVTKDSSLLFSEKELIRRIITSEYWKWIEQHPSEKLEMGVFLGLTGICMELLKLLKQNPDKIGQV